MKIVARWASRALGSVTTVRAMRGLSTLFLITAQVLSPAVVGGPASAQAQTPPPTTPHSLLLNGTTAAAETPDSADLDLVGDWTIELWLKDADPNGFDHTYRYIINKGDGVAGESPFYMLLGNGNLLAGLRTGSVNHPLTYNLHFLGYSPKIWQHVAATFDAASTTLTATCTMHLAI